MHNLTHSLFFAVLKSLQNYSKNFIPPSDIMWIPQSQSLRKDFSEEEEQEQSYPKKTSRKTTKIIVIIIIVALLFIHSRSTRNWLPETFRFLLYPFQLFPIKPQRVFLLGHSSIAYFTFCWMGIWQVLMMLLSFICFKHLVTSEHLSAHLLISHWRWDWLGGG